MRSVSRRLKRRIALITQSGSVSRAVSAASAAASDWRLSGRPSPTRICSHDSGSRITSSARYGLAEKSFNRISRLRGSRWKSVPVERGLRTAPISRSIATSTRSGSATPGSRSASRPQRKASRSSVSPWAARPQIARWADCGSARPARRPHSAAAVGSSRSRSISAIDPGKSGGTSQAPGVESA